MAGESASARLLSDRPNFHDQMDRIAGLVPGGANNILDVYSLSPLQEGMLFHCMLNESSTAYVLSLLFELKSQVHLTAFIDALQKVIDRHDVLRTALLWEKLPEPVQVVYRHARLDVQQVEFNGNADIIEQITDYIRGGGGKMDLRRAPLLRLKVTQDARTERWYAILQVHHLVCDYQSRRLLVAETFAHLEGRERELPEPVSYKTYVADALKDSAARDDKAFFSRKLSDFAETSAPFGLRDVHEDGTRLDEAVQSLDPALGERIRAAARACGVGPARLFHAAWALVVACTSGRSDVVFGTVLLAPQMRGPRPPRMLGVCVNTLPVRLRLTDQSVKDVIQQVQGELRELLEHQHTPLTLAQGCSGVGNAPLFTALLNCRRIGRDADAERLSTEGVVWTHRRGARTNYPVTLIVDDSGDGFALTAQTDRRMQPKKIIGYMETALRSLVQALERAPFTPFLSLSILPEVERIRILERFNDTSTEYPHTKPVHELFEEQVACAPNARAVVWGEEVLTYAELNARANRFAWYLRKMGAAPGEYIPILMPRSLPMLIAQIAVLKCGCAYVPLDPTLPSERLQLLLQDCNPRRLITASEPSCGVERYPYRWIRFDEFTARDDFSVTNLDLQVDALSAAYVMFTSGSTGTPKGVVVPHRAITRLVINNGYAQIGAADCLAHTSNPAFDASTFEIWGALLNGAGVVIVPQSVVLDGARLVETIRRWKINVVWMTVGLFRQHAAALQTIVGQLRYLFTGGDVVEPAVVSPFIDKTSRLRMYNAYGPTECTTFSTTYLIDETDKNALTLPIGRPISNTRIYILDDQLKPVPIGVIGEIYVAGAGVALGYLNRPQLTAEKFIADPFLDDERSRMYRTGDLGLWRNDGNVEFVGRNDHQVKIRGFRMELGEIESHLLQHDQVREAAVVVREYEPGEKRLVAYIAARDGSGFDVEDLKAHLAKVLPDYMVPSAFVRMESLPLMSSGKVDRTALPMPERSSYISAEYDAPRGELETAVAKIWQELLRIERVGRNDNFLDLGGHSLLATRVVARINELLHVDLPLAAIFEAPTLEQLSTRIAAARARQTTGPVLDTDERTEDIRQRIEQMDDTEVLARIAELERELGLDTAKHVEAPSASWRT